MFTSHGPLWRSIILGLCATVIIPATLGADTPDTPQGVALPPSKETLIDRTNWSATADSFAPGHDPAKVFDNDVNTFWQSADGAPLPHYVTIDMKSKYFINAVSYLPQQTATSNGNIQTHTLQVSLDGQNWGPPVAFGTFRNDNSTKTTLFTGVDARYVRLSATNGNVAIASNIKVYSTTFPAAAAGLGRWGPTINLPLIAVAAAVEHDSGKVLVWSSYSEDWFVSVAGGPQKGGKTVTGTFDPSTNTVSERTVSNTRHDMFCPGLSTDALGQLVVTGGNDSPRTSSYDASSDGWVSLADMTIGRGYQSQTTLSDGRTFTIGGSWSGGVGGKVGEVYDPVANKWTKLPGCNVTAMLTGDKEGEKKSDNHAWLFGWKQGSVFQAGPSKQMNWYSPLGTGSQKTAGLRAGDDHSMNGNAVMYNAEAGRILTTGGSIDYAGSPSTSNAHLITINTPNSVPSVSALKNMNYPRMYHTSVILPDGTVFINGGQTRGASFTDWSSNLTPELYTPATASFTPLATNVIPRNYHSTALLLLDGTVFTGGGGLCGACGGNHFDAQIYTPQYLLNGNPRPVIKSVSKTVVPVGGTFDVTTDTTVAKWSLIRYGTSTHTINTDQRRIPIRPNKVVAESQTYSFRLLNDAGILLPGYYMLFALSSQGVPSVAKTIRISIQ